MKKIASLLLVLLLALACVSFSAAEDYTGTWYAVEMSSDGISMDPAQFGMEITLVMNPDGTGSFGMSGEETQEITWKEENGTIILSAAGDDVPLVCDGDSVSMDINGAVIKFSRTAGETFTRPADVLAQDISAFNGTWVPYKFGVGGIYVDMETLASFGLDLSETADLFIVTIDNGNVSLFGDRMELPLVNGALFLETTDAEGAVSSTGIALLEGDMIEVAASEVGISFICVRQAN